MVLGVWENPDAIGIPEALLISIVAILIVFAVLILIILITFLVEKLTSTVLAKTTIQPRKENEILSHDEDAVVAVLVATIDFYKETGKEARVNSITLLEE